MRARPYHLPALALLIALLAATFFVACGDGATAPPPDALRATTITVNPATADLAALGATVQLSAQVRDQNGQAMTGATVTWASSAAAVAAVSASGLVTAVANGSATITATSGSASGSAAVTVAQTVSRVAVSPVADTLVAGDTLRFSAVAADANGHPVVGVEFQWTSSDTAVAGVDASGLATGASAGEAEIAATASGVAGGAALTVLAPVPAAVEVTPDTVELTALGQTVRLAAEVRDQIGRVMTTSVLWSSGDTLVATVDSAGVVTAAGGGATTVTARAGEASGTAAVAVMQAAGSVHVSPATDTIAVGATLRLAAEALDANGNAIAGAAFTWSSSDTSVASVDASGLVRGIAEGRATITAVSGDARGISEITVENPDRAVLVALYEATDGPNWVNNENWLTDAPLWDWYGVDTDVSGRVVRLDLCYNDLSGQIPSRLGHLGSLMSLCLASNNLSGPIPPELGNLADLAQLWLSVNNLSGSIPAEFGNLAKLEVLNLTFNALKGPIPPELGKLERLSELGLRGNRGLCLPDDPQFLAWLAERFSFSFFPCEPPEGRRLPSALMREDGNGLALALPAELRDPSAVIVSNPSVVAASTVGGWLELSPRGRGSADVEVTPSAGGEPVIAEVKVRAAVGTFGIDIVLEQPAPTGYEDVLVMIADWWSSVLDGTEWPDRQLECMTDHVNALVDDMLIYATTFYRSASRTHTGYGDTCPLQSDFPIGGELGIAYGFGHSRGIIAHEIAHHLGLVGWWPSHLVTEDRKYFIGSRAVAAYRAAGGDASLPGVPMDGAHWDLNYPGFDWRLTGGVSLAALADAGYTVDTTKTLPMGKPQAMAASLDDDFVLVGPTALRPGTVPDSAHHRPSGRR